MRNTVTYKSAFAYMAKGIAILGICLWHTFLNCCTDLSKCFIKHPLALLIILASIGYSFYTMATARAERDHMSKIVYQQEITIDSLHIILGR